MIKINGITILLYVVAVVSLLGGVGYLFYLSFLVYFDAVLSSREKFEAFWPAYVFILTGAISGWIAQYSNKELRTDYTSLDMLKFADWAMHSGRCSSVADGEDLKRWSKEKDTWKDKK